ncbi:MAG: membrane protein insertion efficiency factor YidD [Planctomycetota bacterium]|jgi:putative membrane protein insertion efficiency factor
MLKWPLILLLRLYQICLSPILPPCCRYSPTCSAYFIEAVQKYGALKRAWLGIKRLLRCHPFGGYGEDPVP